MPKVMLFIDGSWLYANTSRLATAYGKTDFHLDYGALPRVLGEEVGRQLRMPEVDIIRIYLFGSYAENYDLRDDDPVQRRRDFFSMLKEEYNYEVEQFPINYRGRRIRLTDRDPNDDFVAREKMVDIALSSTMLYFAAIPNAYDIAVVLSGDRDYVPALQHVRRLGKRVALASIRGCCPREFADPADPARIKDLDLIWLNDMLDRIELKYERQLLECQSPLHRGDRKVWTTYRPRKNRPFYCEECRKRFTEEKAAAQQEFLAGRVADGEEGGPLAEGVHRGIIKRMGSKSYGFIAGTGGQEYYFHLTDLEGGLEWMALQVGNDVLFEVKRQPEGDKAGAAARVRQVAAPAPQESDLAISSNGTEEVT